ncbi:MAG: DNA-processing protein DprA [Armatimonadota bacterium]|nr:DNA-processing protein DprA [Armatimonadota bacterium]
MAAAKSDWLPSRFALLLTCVPHLGERQIAQVLHQWTRARLSVDELLALPAERLQREWGLSAQAAAVFTATERTWWKRFEQMDALVRRHGIQVLTAQHRLYPLALESFCEQPPPVLFAQGQLGLLQGGWRFAVACSREAPHLALEAVDEVAQQAIREGGVPVTGHNTPSYQRVALAAIRQERASITVLDRGLVDALGEGLNRPLFPAARLYDLQFRVDRDLVLSPFPLQAGSLGLYNQRRDELVFALADVVFAVWVRAGGVMERLCLRARELGKRIEVWKAPDGTVSDGVKRLAQREPSEVEPMGDNDAR